MEAKLYYILNMYGRVLFCMVTLLVAVICFTKKTNILWKLPFTQEGGFIQENEKIINDSIYIMISVISLLVIILSFPRLRDLKSVLTNDFLIKEGVVISQDYSDEMEKKNRTVIIESKGNESDEKYYIFQCPLLEKGEKITIYYYKNSRTGFLKQLQ